MMIEFTVPERNETVRLPALWQGNEPKWLRDHGRTVVAVIDDQIQSLAGLSDVGQLKRQVCEPLNVEFVFFEECALGKPRAKGRAWFDSVVTRLQRLQDRLALVLLDVMFEDESDALSGSGLAFLRLLHEKKTLGDVPVIIMTQARDEPQLQKAIAEAGYSCEFFPKRGGRVDALCLFLCRHGWLSDPMYGAYSPAMRRELAKLRQYAITRPHLAIPGQDFQPLSPLLFTAASGEGKTVLANIAANWLREVQPGLWRTESPTGQRHIEPLHCNELIEGQNARLRLFGRGSLTGRPRPDRGRRRDDLEVPDATGLVERGATQLAANGILLIDELGNSPPGVQKLLLSFVETGRTQPEFPSNQMTEEALGPLDVLCIFTAQPVHIEGGSMIPDMKRRFSRGGTIQLPPLHERPEDIVPLFYHGLKAHFQAHNQSWTEPDEINEFLLPEAQKFLQEEVVKQRLSSSTVIDLVGSPSATIRAIGIPYLKHRLGQVKLPPPPPPPPTQPVWPLQPPPPPPPALGTDLDSLLDQAARLDTAMFPQDARRVMALRDKVFAAGAKPILCYLEAAISAATDASGRLNIVETARVALGKDLKNAQAKTELKDLLLVDAGTTLEALGRSELLPRLAIEIADGKRSKEVAKLLVQLVARYGPDQLDRLIAMGWNDFTSCVLEMVRPRAGRGSDSAALAARLHRVGLVDRMRNEIASQRDVARELMDIVMSEWDQCLSPVKVLLSSLLQAVYVHNEAWRSQVVKFAVGQVPLEADRDPPVGLVFAAFHAGGNRQEDQLLPLIDWVDTNRRQFDGVCRGYYGDGEEAVRVLKARLTDPKFENALPLYLYNLRDAMGEGPEFQDILAEYRDNDRPTVKSAVAKLSG